MLLIPWYTKEGGFIHNTRTIFTWGQDMTEVSLYKQNTALRYRYSALFLLKTWLLFWLVYTYIHNVLIAWHIDFLSCYPLTVKRPKTHV